MEQSKAQESAKTKTCSCCGRTLPLDCYYTSNQNKDGYYSECKDCKRKYADNHRKSLKLLKEKIAELEKANTQKLTSFTPRQLIDELSRRGYKGELTYVQHIKV